MANISSREELRGWLRGKPVDWAQIIAVRAAMRALPYLTRADSKWLSDFGQAAIRAIFISWAARNCPAHDMARAAADAARAASYAAADAAAYAAYAARAAFWQNVENDCNWLAENGGNDSVVRKMTGRSLWSDHPQKGWLQEWEELAARLRTIDPGYKVWINWFDRRINGERAAFDIPGDKERKEDKKILIRLADATDEDFWGQGAEYVNHTLQGWIDGAREQVKPQQQTSTPEETRKQLIRSASPQAQIVNDRLDAGPNTVFDKPQYSENLADLPSEIRSFLDVLTKSLPRNASDVLRNSLTAYSDELLVRGNRPILNILKGMTASISAEIWKAPDEEDKDNPDVWQAKDAREWDAGTIEMFRTLAKYHLDLIHHFPLDPERETIIAATPVDEFAASERALTDPVDAVTNMIVALNKEGMSTDNIVKIVEAHKQYTHDIAGLPKPDQDMNLVVTPKRRHVLMTLGFYLHTYSILGTTASLAMHPSVVGLMSKLADAIATLQSFIR